MSVMISGVRVPPLILGDSAYALTILFWFLAFAGFVVVVVVVVVAAVGRQVWHNVFDISFAFFTVLCTIFNDNLGRINENLWLSAGLS